MKETRTQKRKPTVAIIGAGRLGQALALALHSAGYPVVALVARSRRKAEKAAALLADAKPRPIALTLNDLGLLASRGSGPRADVGQQGPTANGVDLAVTDLLIIATPDDAIAETAQRLATLHAGKAGRQTLSKKTVLHTSGALSSAVLSPLAKIGFHTGSLHPLVSVSEPRAGARGLHGAFYCLEGHPTALRLARMIVRDMQGTSFSIRPESKALYHAAALMAAGHVTALVDLSTELLASCGLKPSLAREALLTLVESAVGNLQVSSPEKALTGTFARGDLATVQRHLRALSGNAEALAVYKLLGLRSLRLAAKNKLDPERMGQIRKLLSESKQ